MLRIAVQSKGRLYDETMAVLAEAGIKLRSAKRMLLVQAKDFPVEVLFLRDDDIPQSVANGAADIGIVGENEYAEKNQPVDIIKRLGFSRCRLSLAIPKTVDYPGVEWFNGKTVATSYPEIVARYFEEKGITAELHVITGSVEIAPGIGLADAIFDIVSSGSTLVTNQLKEVEVVMQSEALMIARPNLEAEKAEILDEILFRMDAIRAAENKKYILLNAPNDKLGVIVKLLPGMKSPSIIPSYEEGWSSLHSVISEKNFWEVIGQLKAMGAEDILVCPIEKMIL